MILTMHFPFFKFDLKFTPSMEIDFKEINDDIMCNICFSMYFVILFHQ